MRPFCKDRQIFQTGVGSPAILTFQTILISIKGKKCVPRGTHYFLSRVSRSIKEAYTSMLELFYFWLSPVFFTEQRAINIYNSSSCDIWMIVISLLIIVYSERNNQNVLFAGINSIHLSEIWVLT